MFSMKRLARVVPRNFGKTLAESVNFRTAISNYLSCHRPILAADSMLSSQENVV
jgi:hypothetical protein